jgi:predicted ATPase
MAHFTGFGLENFRVFEKKQWFDLAPITVFTGTNNSGKSSVNKALILLKENLYRKTMPFDEFTVGDDSINNLGSVKHFINNHKKDISFYFGFSFKKNVKKNNDKWTLKLTYANIVNSKEYTPYLKELSIYQLSEKVPIVKISVEPHLDNDFEYIDVKYFIDFEKIISKYYEEKTILIESYIDDKHNLIEIFKSYNSNALLLSRPNFYQKLLKRNLSEDDIETIMKLELKLLSQDISIGSSQGLNLFSEYLGAIGHDKDVWPDEHDWIIYNALFQRLISEFDLNTNESEKEFEAYSTHEIDVTKNFRNFIRDVYKSIVVQNVQEAFGGFKNMSIINYNRLHTDRLIMNKGGENVNFKALTYLKRHCEKSEDDFIQLKDENGLNFISKWAKNFGLDIKFSDVEGIAFNLQVKSGNDYRNLADVGLGINQVITIILAVSTIPNIYFERNASYKILVLEEPEAGLHPALQSKLAELIVDANKTFGTQFIIETHSEYFIRKLQYLTANKTISPEDLWIYYFYPPNGIPKGEKQVKKIKIFEDGRLSADFGPGFFDESTNLVEEMWKARNLN